ncbi:MAG: helix-turn-helix domain-containing protein [Pikeienuella sp.]
MARMTKEAWLALGREALTEAGPDELTIDALTARAGKTRGSFYHHFRGHDDFLRALAAAWRREVEAGAPPPDAAALALERGMRRLTRDSAAVAAELDAADATRLDQHRRAQADPESPVAADYAAIARAVRRGLIADASTTPERLARLGRLTDEMIATHWHE